MWGDLYLYLAVLFDKYQAVAGIAVPSFLAAWSLALLDRFKEVAGYRAESVVRIGRLAIAFLAVFLVGFLAWRDEHSARENAEGRLVDQKALQIQSALSGNRLNFGPIGGSSCSNSCVFDLPLSNIGQTPITIKAALISAEALKDSMPTKIVREKLLEQKNWTRKFVESNDSAQDLGPSLKTNAKVDANFKNDDRKLFDENNLQVYILATVVYLNAQTPDKMAIQESYCIYIKRDTSGTYPCGVADKATLIALPDP